MADRDISLRLAVTDAEASIRRLREFGDKGDQALGRIASASRPASAGLNAVNQSSLALQATLGRVAPALMAFGAGLGGIVVGGVAALAGGLALGVKNAEAAERSLLRLDGVLKATGGSAGLTAREITALGDQMERSTRASGEAVVDAAAALATFKSVSGDTFTDAIRLSQDLAAVFGGDLTSTASQLGKALEDPVHGLESLRDKGVTFSAAQQDVIKSLVETGEGAEAQRQILEALEKQVGGAGAAEAGGLTGAFAALRAELGDLLQDFAEATGAAGALEEALRGSARAIGAVRETFADDPFGDLARVQGEIAALQRQLATSDPAAGLRGGALTALDRRDTEAQLAALKEQERALGRVIAAQQGAQVAARVAAAEAAKAAEQERQADQRRAVAADTNKRATEAEKKAREAAAAAAAKQAEAAAKAIADARVALDQQTRLRAALEEGVEAHEAVARAIEVENAVRKAGLDLESAQGQVLAGLVAGRQAEAEAIDEVKAARERLARLEDERRRRIEDRGFDPSAGVADFASYKAAREADQAREAEAMAAVFIRPTRAAQARATARLRTLRS